MLISASHHLNLKQVVIFLLVEDIALMLMVVNQSGWWLLNTDIAVVLKTTLKFAASIDYSFHNFSAACNAVG